MKADLVVVGAGPSGTTAAVEAAACGLDVILLDEKSPVEAPATVRQLFGHLVWSVTPGFWIEAIGPAGRVTIEAERLVVATGAIERMIPFPGWTLPGVVGLSDAGDLPVIPGHRILVAGYGPLLGATARRLRAQGAEIVVACATADQIDWDAPLLTRHAVRRAAGNGIVEQVQLGPIDADGGPIGEGRWIEADGLCVGYGLIPASGIPSLLRAPHRFDPARGGWVPVLDVDGRTGIGGLYAAGGAVGMTDVEAARSGGRRAGRAAARDAGITTLDGDVQQDFEAAVGPVWSGLGLVDAIPPETIICRCEGVTRAGIEAALAEGAREMNQMKHFTRCGMGECQGRICADTVAALLARHVGSRAAAGRWTMRPPLRPVPLAALLGCFEYDDIPVPHPAPL